MHTPTHSTDAPFPRPPCSTSQQGSGGARTLTHSPTRDRRTPAAHEAHAHGTKCMRDLGQTVRALAARMQTWQWHMPAALHPYDVTRHILFNRAMCSVSAVAPHERWRWTCAACRARAVSAACEQSEHSGE